MPEGLALSPQPCAEIHQDVHGAVHFTRDTLFIPKKHAPMVNHDRKRGAGFGGPHLTRPPHLGHGKFEDGRTYTC